MYLVSGAPLTYRAALWAAVMATRGVLGFDTAAQLWGLTDAEPHSIHVVIPAAARVTRPHGCTLHRRTVPANHVQRSDGLALTSRDYTVVDMLGALPWSQAVRLADRSMQRGWIQRSDVERRLDGPRQVGHTQLRRILGLLGDGAAAESERRLHRLLRGAGIRGWTANHAVRHRGAVIAVVDVAFVHRRLAVEVDGMAYHVDVDRFRGDRVRQNRLVALGWTVLRFTWADLTERPDYVIGAIISDVPRRVVSNRWT